jgi:DNA-binding response OmpR family regulator
MNLATQSLTFTSTQAARLWQQLEQTENSHEIDDLVSSIWQLQNEQERTIDIYVALAHQIDAEITAIKARMEYLIDVHKTAISKLETWRSSLDKTILNLRGCLKSRR